MKKHILAAAIICGTLLINSCGTTAPAYVNDEFDIGFNPLSSMELSNEAELASISGEGSVCEMVATNTETGSAVVISVQDDIYGGADSYLEIIKASLVLDDYNITYSDITKAEIAGEEYSLLDYSVEALGMAMSMSTYARSEDGKLLLINVSYTDSSELGSLLGCFTEIG